MTSQFPKCVLTAKFQSIASSERIFNHFGEAAIFKGHAKNLSFIHRIKVNEPYKV